MRFTISVRTDFPTGNYLGTRNTSLDTRTRCEICSKLTVKTQGEHFSYIATVFLLLTLSW